MGGRTLIGVAARRRPTGGVGSNQYKTRGTSAAADTTVRARAARFTTPPPAAPARSVGELAARAGEVLAAYREHCAAAGVDPDAELAAGMLEHGVSAGVWISWRLARLHPDDLDPDDDLNVTDPVQLAHELRGRNRRDLVLALAHENTRVAMWLAKNLPNDQDHHLLCGLATDPRWEVRAAVVENRSAPEHLLARVAADSDRRVRLAAADDITIPERVLAGLKNDVDAEVVETALLNERLRKPLHER